MCDTKTAVVYLMRPEMYHEAEVMDYRKECLDAGEKRINGSCGLHHYEAYESWIGNVRMNEQLPKTDRTTPADTYLAFRAEDDRLVGTIQLRHGIPMPLSLCGGHIGYEVRPSERRKGYATAMLRLVVQLAARLGIESVRVDCDKENAASRNTILKCGGVFERELFYSCNDYSEIVQHFVIATCIL